MRKRCGHVPIDHKFPAAQVGRLHAGKGHDKRGDIFGLWRATERHPLARGIELLRHGLLEVTRCTLEGDLTAQSRASPQQLDRRNIDNPPVSSRLHRESSVVYLEGVVVDLW